MATEATEKGSFPIDTADVEKALLTGIEGNVAGKVLNVARRKSMPAVRSVHGAISDYVEWAGTGVVPPGAVPGTAHAEKYEKMATSVTNWVGGFLFNQVGAVTKAAIFGAGFAYKALVIPAVRFADEARQKFFGGTVNTTPPSPEAVAMTEKVEAVGSWLPGTLGAAVAMPAEFLTDLGAEKAIDFVADLHAKGPVGIMKPVLDRSEEFGKYFGVVASPPSASSARLNEFSGELDPMYPQLARKAPVTEHVVIANHSKYVTEIRVQPQPRKVQTLSKENEGMSR